MLTTNERNYLLNSMEELLVEYNYEYTTNALEDIINEWARQKANLICAFKKHPNYIDGQFMIAFDADYERKIELNPSYNFKRWIMNTAMPEMDGKLPTEVQERTNPGEYLPQSMWDFFYFLANYAERCISENTAKHLNNIFDPLRFHAGQKTSRVVNKICCYLGFDKVDGYNREFAKYADSLSPMVIKRHTVLSINPLDYLTMSFGNSWASCHTIDKENKRRMPNNYSGCYSSGTISYMLDETSMVLYTVDAAYDGNEYWTQSKINRQMFHYGEEKLVQGRLYPQDNDGDDTAYAPYRTIVQQIISTIFDFPNLWVLKRGYNEVGRYTYSYGTHYRDYNHYSNCTISLVKGTYNDECLSIGADPICIECGDRHETEANINCCGYGRRCASCGARISNEDDEYWVEGECYCRDCVSYCDRCDRYHIGDSTWIQSEDRYVCSNCLNMWYSHCGCCDEYAHEDNMYYIECEDRHVCEDCLERYYRYCEDCGEYFPEDEVREYDYLTLCKSCYADRKSDNKENVG